MGRLGVALGDRLFDIEFFGHAGASSYESNALARGKIPGREEPTKRRVGLPGEFVESILTGWWTSCLEILPAKERVASRY
jgi:hypothetical protein